MKLRPFSPHWIPRLDPEVREQEIARVGRMVTEQAVDVTDLGGGEWATAEDLLDAYREALGENVDAYKSPEDA